MDTRGCVFTGRPQSGFSGIFLMIALREVPCSFVTSWSLLSPWLLPADVDPHLLAVVLVRLLRWEVPFPSAVPSGRGTSAHPLSARPFFLLCPLGPSQGPFGLHKAEPPFSDPGARVTLSRLRRYPPGHAQLWPQRDFTKDVATSTCTQTPPCLACRHFWGLCKT